MISLKGQLCKDVILSIAQLRETIVCGLVFNRISVRFLMAPVQWCSGYVSFLLFHGTYP